MSGILFLNVNNIQSMMPEDQKIQLHNEVRVVRVYIIQPPPTHLTPAAVSKFNHEKIDYRLHGEKNSLGYIKAVHPWH